MSQARPMSSRARRHAYQPDGGELTVRQRRRLERMRHLEELRDAGLLRQSKASGVPVRKPLARARKS